MIGPLTELDLGKRCLYMTEKRPKRLVEGCVDQIEGSGRAVCLSGEWRYNEPGLVEMWLNDVKKAESAPGGRQGFDPTK